MKIEIDSNFCFCLKFILTEENYRICSKKMLDFNKDVIKKQKRENKKKSTVWDKAETSSELINSLLMELLPTNMEFLLPANITLNFFKTKSVNPIIMIDLFPSISIMEEILSLATRKFEMDEEFKSNLSKEEIDIYKDTFELIKDSIKEKKEKLPEYEEKNFIRFGIGWEILQKTNYDKKLLNFDLLKDIFSLLIFLKEKVNEEIEGYICSKLILDKNKYVIKGGIELPQKIPTTQKIIETVGKPEIQGFELKFLDSPIGIDKLSLKIDKSYILIEFKIDYLTDIPENFIEDIFKIISKVNNLFISEEK